nr:uncharacterized protein LOC117994922 [Maniola hyperantus]
MNVNVDYAQHMIQKHQLAIALAIIKTKPAEISYEAFIDSIKNKINQRNMDSNLDITICEEDFNISDDFTQCDDQMMNDDDQMLNDDHNMIGDELNKSHDSVNILNNFALADLNDPSKENDDLESLLEFMTEMTNFEGNSEILKNTPQINFSQLTNFEETQMPVNIISTQTKEIADNIGIACNTYVVNDHKADDETLKLISYLKENLQLKQCVMNNVPNETKEVISHQEKMKECILNNNKEMDIVTQNDLSDNETDTQLEIVPFKVLDGLNRIKCYLNRSDRKLSEGNNNSMDSGFKSSQARSSYMSDAWKDEWAQCLLSFVTGSQLSANTTVITDEISAILGKMVDKLHEEEKYPIFLEELLENVNTLLNDVYKGNNEESNALLKREDDIYRLLLLNRSTHIIKYTIEKIITILEKTISDIKEDVFELKHTNEAENICYIFHILEILLKRYKKSNESSQMSIQNTQDDDKVLKKSSLTEIWRKKWNLTKSEAIEGSAKKTCVLTKCSEVLNKMIVQAMDGYSLVSFAALQCFNLLQN